MRRRTFLRGAGAAVALPLLHSLAPRAAWADPARPPVRLAFVFVPNGMHMEQWTPAEIGRDFVLPPLLEPLAARRADFSILTGLTLDGARAHGDGPGDHARSGATFLTCTHPRKTDGADIRAGISVDQVAALTLGRETRFPSLELGCDSSAQSGNCDSGYSCAYSSNISWRSPTSPAPKERNPRLVFERLFTDDSAAATPAERSRRLQARRSILDLVAGEARSLKSELARADGDKLEQYLSSLREVERRIERAEESGGAGAEVGMARPTGVPESYEEHLRLLLDLMVLAFQTDSTRVVTHMFANAGSNRSYPFAGVPEGHHGISHHGGDAANQTKIAAINRFHVTQLAYALERLAQVREGDGTLLDQTMLVYGSGIGDGNRHNHDDLPILLAGRGGALTPGQHLRYEHDTPLANLYLAMLGKAGVPAKTFGDSTAPLAGI